MDKIITRSLLVGSGDMWSVQGDQYYLYYLINLIISRRNIVVVKNEITGLKCELMRLD